MLVGRTFSYSDTQRYRVGPNYLQLPINQPLAKPATNQRDGQMAYYVDGTGSNPHVNYEPNSTGGLREADRSGPDYEPEIHGRLTRAKIERTNDFAQAGERYRTMPDWEREDLVAQPDRPARPVRAADPGADGRAVRAVRPGLRGARRGGPRDRVADGVSQHLSHRPRHWA